MLKLPDLYPEHGIQLSNCLHGLMVSLLTTITSRAVGQSSLQQAASEVGFEVSHYALIEWL